MAEIILKRMVGGNKRYPHTQVFTDVGVTVVDDADGDLAQYRWGVETKKRKDGSLLQHAQRHENGKTVCLHRVIVERMGLQLGPGLEVDHIDGDGLNNQRENLRVADYQMNGMNRRKQLGSSKFKGVYWDKQSQKWRALIAINRKRIHLGYYDDELEAARAYDRKAIELFGPYAKLNFPREDYL